MPENPIFCAKCGTPNISVGTFCQKCGAGLVAPTISAGAPAVLAPAVTYVPAAPAVWSGYGGFWIRFVAFIIDGIIVRIAALPFAAIFGMMGLMHRRTFRGPMDEAGALAMAAAALALVPVLVAINWLYEALLTSSSWQGTIGKKLLNLKVTDEAGNRISFARATGRFFAKILSSFLLIGFIMAAFTDRKRALHDILADTLVKKG